MTALLASVRSADEAFDAAQAGAELIDLKEPRGGALGGVATSDIVRIVIALRARYPVRPISATIGGSPARSNVVSDLAAPAKANTRSSSTAGCGSGSGAGACCLAGRRRRAGRDDATARVCQQERPCSKCALRLPGAHAALADQRRLLVARNPHDRDPVRKVIQPERLAELP